MIGASPPPKNSPTAMTSPQAGSMLREWLPGDVAGTAPVSYQSGQIHRVRVRYQCNKVLRHTVHLWAQCCVRVCPWAEVYYRQKRAEGKSHACALRCLGQRWLKILWKMWQTKTCYNPDFHLANQLKHGSWILAVKPTK